MHPAIKKISGYMHIYASDNLNIKNEKHESFEIFYVLSGEIHLSVGERDYLLHRDEFIIINSEEIHSCRESSGAAAMFYMTYPVLCSMLNRYQFRLDEQQCRGAGYLKPLQKTLGALLNIYIEGNEAESLEYYAGFFKLASILKAMADEKVKASEEIDKASGKYEARIMKIINYIAAAYDTPVTLNELSEALGLTPSYTSKFFKKHMHTNFVDYVNSVRISHAASDILNTQKSMLEISNDNGFPSVSVFNKVFKQTYKMTPSAYQKQQRAAYSALYDAGAGAQNRELLKRYFLGSAGKRSSEKTDLEIEVDDKKPYEAVIKPCWNRIVNIGTASELLNLDTQKYLVELKEKLNLQYVRFGRLIDKSMYIDMSQKQLIYNFTAINRALDFLVANKLKPFFNIGESPVAIHKTLNEFLWLDEHPAIVDEPAYCRFMEQFMAHIMLRYGREEISTWCFELWRNNSDATVEKYLDFFTAFYAIIKQFDERIQVGGPGYLHGQTSRDTMSGLLDAWGKSCVRPDFISIKLYHYECMQKDGRQQAVRSRDKDYVRAELKWLSAVKEACGMGEIPVIVSEWNETISSRSSLNDGCNRAAYIVRTLIRNLNGPLAFAYWSAMDSTVEYFDTVHLLNGANGLITKNGLKKPAYYGFDFMNCMGRLLAGKGENYLVTKDEEGNYQILIHNYKTYQSSFYEMKEDEIDITGEGGIFKDLETLYVSIHMRHLPYGKFRVRQIYVNQYRGSIYHEWKKMNFIAEPTAGELEYLAANCKPGGGIFRHYMITDGQLNLKLCLQPFEITLITLNKI